VKLNDGVPVAVATEETNGYKVTIPELKRAWSPRTKALVLNNPSNPTGQIYTREELEMMGYFCYEHEIYIIADEIYERLAYDGLSCTSIASLGDYIKRFTVLINGVSKTYAMTGWRIGYTASPPDIARVMGAIQSHATSNPNSIAQKAAVAALDGPQECLAEMLQAFDQRRTYMYQDAKDALPEGFEAPGSLLCVCEHRGGPGEIIKGSRYRTAMILPPGSWRTRRWRWCRGRDLALPRCIRLSYATSMDNIVKGLDRLEAFLKELA
jgi:aspartate aminotransferase